MKTEEQIEDEAIKVFTAEGEFRSYARLGFIKGAKWMQESSQSLMESEIERRVLLLASKIENSRFHTTVKEDLFRMLKEF
jgi:hypothetical protein